MNTHDDALGKVVWFCLTCYFVNTQLGLGDMATYAVTIGLWLIAWLAVWQFGKARRRLGTKAWFTFTFSVALAAAYIYLAPPPWPFNLLTVWGLGIPLIFVGAAAEWLRSRIAFLRTELCQDLILWSVGGWATVAYLTAGWWYGYAFWDAVWIAAWPVIAGFPVAIGMDFAGTGPAKAHDARIGTDEEFNKAGASRDR